VESSSPERSPKDCTADEKEGEAIDKVDQVETKYLLRQKPYRESTQPLRVGDCPEPCMSGSRATVY
jgi:hypothetical protein